MEREIELNNRQVRYILRVSKRAKRMRLAVYCDGAVVLTVPQYLQETLAEKFIREKSQWLFSKIDFFRQFQGRPAARHNRESYFKHKSKALDFVREKVGYFNQFYGCQFNKINIKNQKTRWGSCSRKGNLNFNYKILFLPPEIADYIIVHELCHLKEFNHSRKFWNLIGKTLPDYSEIRSKLKKSRIIF